MIQRLRRPASRGELPDYLHRLCAALDELGVGHGEEFVIAKPEDVDVTNGQLGPFMRQSSTSREAAIGSYPRQGTNRQRVLEAIKARGEHGMTRNEIAERFGWSDSQTHPRAWELVNGGFVVAQGTRPSRLRHDAEVLVATPKAYGMTTNQ